MYRQPRRACPLTWTVPPIRVETVGETNHLRNLAGQFLEHVRVTGTVRTRLWWAVAPRLAELPAAEQEAIRRAVGTAPFWP